MEKLKFLETVTVNEFKAQKGVNKIEIKQNPCLLYTSDAADE